MLPEIIQRGLQLPAARVGLLGLQPEVMDERCVHLQKAGAGIQLAGHGGGGAQRMEHGDAVEQFAVRIFARRDHIMLLGAVPEQCGKVHRQVADVRERGLIDNAADGGILRKADHLMHGGRRHKDHIALRAFAVRAGGKQADASAGHFDHFGGCMVMDVGERFQPRLRGKIQGKEGVGEAFELVFGWLNCEILNKVEIVQEKKIIVACFPYYIRI